MNFRTFGLSLNQIKPNILPEIHAVKIDAAGIGSGLLQGGKQVILQGGNRQHAATGCFYRFAVGIGARMEYFGVADIFGTGDDFIFKVFARVTA